ncbi:hypothetical protein N800_11755 [Lysobacter daejeonensis GH1-9]|uniref:Uncharacterized protein n=2 Tax=Aerolutibacter TaxID=3382701 RepID=A0A0A0EXV5_9GAMM|nr:hypothetical protein N800_11755 [Lysobacter daejeonensis GH1-9]
MEPSLDAGQVATMIATPAPPRGVPEVGVTESPAPGGREVTHAEYASQVPPDGKLRYDGPMGAD